MTLSGKLKTLQLGTPNSSLTLILKWKHVTCTAT